MSELENNTPVGEETPKQEPKTEKEAQKDVKKKPNIFKRAINRTKKWMGEHPFLSATISAAGGAAASIAAAEGAKKVMENRRNGRNATIQQVTPVNDLDPNN